MHRYRVEHPAFDVSEDLLDRRIEDYLEARRIDGWWLRSLAHIEGTTFLAVFFRERSRA